MKGEEQLAAGKIEQAEHSLLKGVDLYRRARDASDVAFALGRLGAFYKQVARIDDAIAALDEALRLGTDIPVIHVDRMSIAAEAGDGETLFRVAHLYYEHLTGWKEQALDILIGLAGARGPADDLAQEWLARVQEWAELEGLTSQKFRSWGLRAHLRERHGDLEPATRMCEEAIGAGSADRLTFTRLLMIYEKAKRWNDLLELARKGLEVQRDASWEVDLRKRIQRVEVKTGLITKAQRSSIPAFTVKQGKETLKLVEQVDLSPPVSSIGLSPNGRWIVASAASRKPGNLCVYDLTENAVAWRATLPAPSARVFAADDGACVAVTQSGRIGDGETEISFLDHEGSIRSSVLLSDKLSEVQVTKDAVFAGCRDGCLYKYNMTGKLAWKHTVPSRAQVDRDNPYQRACPYFIRTSTDGARILYSSWDRVFMLDGAGSHLWTWQAAAEPTRFRYTVPLSGTIASSEDFKLLGVDRAASEDEVKRAFRRRAFETHPDRNPSDALAADRFKDVVRAYESITTTQSDVSSGSASITLEMTISAGLNSIYGLAVGDDGRAIVTASDGGLTFLDARGRIIHVLVASDGAGSVHAAPDLTRIVYAHWDGLSFYSENGLTNVYPTERLYDAAIRSDGEFIVAWLGKHMLGFDGHGSLLWELEFAKNIGGMAFRGNDQLIVGAGKLICFDLDPRN